MSRGGSAHDFPKHFGVITSPPPRPLLSIDRNKAPLDLPLDRSISRPQLHPIRNRTVRFDQLCPREVSYDPTFLARLDGIDMQAESSASRRRQTDSIARSRSS